MRLKHKIITKMIKKKLTRTEVDFLIYLSKYQDQEGQVSGIYYKNVIQDLGISVQKFYDLRDSLVKKELISADKGHYTDWDIQILENDFNFEEGQKNEPYLNMNLRIFSNSEFQKLKGGEKLLALEFLRMASASGYRYSIKIGLKEFYRKYEALFGVKKRILQDYLTSLRKFFSIGLKDGIYYITPLKETREKERKLEVQIYDEFARKVFCRRNKIDPQSKEAHDTFALLKQYGKKGITFNKLFVAIVKSWKLLNKRRAEINVRKWTKALKPELVHKILREEILFLS